MNVHTCQSCLTLCNPMDCSPPVSSAHVIFPARILEWVAISFSRESFWPGGWTHVFGISCIGGQILYHLGFPLSFWSLLKCHFLREAWWLRWLRICLRCKTSWFDPWVGKIPQRRKWQPTPVSLTGKSMDRGAWWASVHGIAKSQPQPSN